MRILTSLIVLLVGLMANAGDSSYRVGLEAGNVIDNQSLTGTQTLKVAYDAYLLYSISRDGNFALTIGHLYLNSIEPVTATTSALLKSYNPYLGLKFGLGPKQEVAMSLEYIPYSQASYTQTGTATETWVGSGYVGKISMQPKLTDKLAGTLSLQYFSGRYTSKTANNGAVTSATSFSRTLVIPTIGLQYQF